LAGELSAGLEEVYTVTTTIAAPEVVTPRPIGRQDPLTRREWGRVGGMFGFIALLHIVGFGVLIAFVAPEHYKVGGATFGIATGLTAYTLGLRHAFDADHIAAIDNTTRKLMAEGKRPLSVGLWFSLGHSSVVVALTLLLGLGMKAIGAQLTDDSSSLHSIGGLIGTLVSGLFLYLLGIINLVILLGILKVFRGMRRGHYDEVTLEEHLNNRGFMNRFLGKTMRAISKPVQIYPVGILFGLGFDTVTEVALLVLAGTSVAAGLPWYAIMCLPILFAAGMSLFDTIDGSFMNFAYGWAFSKPVRKVYYNITITGLSVAVALLIGTAELLSILSNQLKLTGGFWDWIDTLNLNSIGYGIVIVFILTWVIAWAVWKIARIEDRWSANLQPASQDVATTATPASVGTITSEP
jgi:nickel/cobalt transporter (NiCoT) family protein